MTSKAEEEPIVPTTDAAADPCLHSWHCCRIRLVKLTEACLDKSEHPALRRMRSKELREVLPLKTIQIGVQFQLSGLLPGFALWSSCSWHPSVVTNKIRSGNDDGAVRGNGYIPQKSAMIEQCQKIPADHSVTHTFIYRFMRGVFLPQLCQSFSHFWCCSLVSDPLLSASQRIVLLCRTNAVRSGACGRSP